MPQEKSEIDKELESGKYLFKYCKFDINALQIIINKTLYFCSPDKLNDPLDSKFDLEIENPNNFSDKTIGEIKQSTPFLSARIQWLLMHGDCKRGNVESLKNLFKEYFTYIQNEHCGICCFSQTHSENLLWTHYAQEAKGMCLGFDKEKLLEYLKKQRNSGYEILPDPITYKGVKKLNVRLLKNGEFSYTINHLFSKTSCWEYEKEYRFVLSQIDRIPFDFISISNEFNPFFKFDDECLKFIIMGERIPTEHAQMLKRLKEDKTIAAEILKRNSCY